MSTTEGDTYDLCDFYSYIAYDTICINSLDSHVVLLGLDFTSGHVGPTPKSVSSAAVVLTHVLG